MGEADGTRGALTDPHTDRAETMARSVDAAIRRRSMAPETADDVRSALALAMEPRRAALEDDHHPAFLHPGRAVLVLLHDVEHLPGDALPLAALLESLDAALRVPAGRIAEIAGPDVERSLASIPLPGDEALTEGLVLLPRAPALAALAERLDHLRHLHLRPDLGDAWADMHESTGRVWLPLAERLDARLATRFRHWHRIFARRLPPDPGASTSDAAQLPRV